MTTIEQTALNNLIHNEPYARKVLPFIKGDYFSDRTERIVFEEIQKFVDKYNALPNQNSLEVELDSRKDCLLYTSPSPRDATLSRMPSSA